MVGSTMISNILNHLATKKNIKYGGWRQHNTDGSVAEEWFGVTKRTTGPTTIYKKQKLDRDDIIDITDFDVVVWLKGEMRLMMDEELARAILIGDGREVDDDCLGTGIRRLTSPATQPVSPMKPIFTVRPPSRKLRSAVAASR